MTNETSEQRPLWELLMISFCVFGGVVSVIILFLWFMKGRFCASRGQKGIQKEEEKETFPAPEQKPAVSDSLSQRIWNFDTATMLNIIDEVDSQCESLGSEDPFHKEYNPTFDMQHCASSSDLQTVMEDGHFNNYSTTGKRSVAVMAAACQQHFHHDEQI